ncbi:redoxin family protein [Peredibacter sp. HCB2-198]|uniref:redoxin family protein n=1 Tax=Peredibacter sp. HCB2-198 TaxID=3383025 RepID=UPI0038B69F2A
MKFFLLGLLWIGAAIAKPLPALNGPLIKSGENLSWKWEDAKIATAIVFLSAVCPCSDGHIAYLKKLKEDYPQVDFIGVHSNTDEDAKSTLEYFTEKNLNFNVLQDDKAKIADLFGAYRTPHSFLVSKNGEILFKGGVTSSSVSAKADTFYLADAIKNVVNGEEVKVKQARTLGCQIGRD